MTGRVPMVLLTGVVAVLSCTEPTGPVRPVPGTLVVSLTAPNADDRALVAWFVLARGATMTAITAEPGFEVFHRVSADTVRVAIFGEVAAATMIRMAVTDVRDPERAVVQEVAGPDDQLRASLAGYSLTVRPR